MPRGRKKTVRQTLVSTPEQAQELMTAYRQELDRDPTYSLEVDPTGYYKMSDMQKQFIQMYLEYHNLPVIGQMLDMDAASVMEMYFAESTQNEIKRITKARYARQFTHKVLTMQELAGWLSSLLTDENVPECDRLKTREKLDVAKMIMSIAQQQVDAMNNPKEMTTKDFEEQIKDMSVDAIKQLLMSTEDTSNNKDAIISAINKSQESALSAEDLAYLKTLSYSELLKILKLLDKEEV